MCVVLLEAAHPCEAGQGAGQLIPMQNSEVGHAERQLLVGTRSVVENEAVARAVHRLQPERLLLNIKSGEKF